MLGAIVVVAIVICGTWETGCDFTTVTVTNSRGMVSGVESSSYKNIVMTMIRNLWGWMILS